jgi:type VI secretion system FHA domain protein
MASLHVALCSPDTVTGERSFVFTESGGSIGRSSQCDWSIDDGERFISSTHLLVAFMNGTFTFTDTSSNGTYLNTNQLDKGVAIKPSVNDVFTLGNIDIKVTAIDDLTTDTGSDTQSDLLNYVVPKVTQNESLARPPISDVDNLGLFDILAQHPSKPTPSQEHSKKVSSEPISPTLIPDDWDSEEPLAQPSVEKNTQSEENRSFSDKCYSSDVKDDFFDLVYEQLGLPKANKAEVNKHRFAADIATLVKQSTQGVMALLAGRSALKQESRLSMTMIQPKSNNPIKFSLDPSDTLDMLLVRKKPGYMDVTDAYAEAFGDLQNHQTAFIAGLQACLAGVLNELSPDAVEQEAHTLHRNFLGKTKVAQKWQVFTAKQENLTVKVKENFNDILAEHFSSAYESQVKQLQRKENES